MVRALKKELRKFIYSGQTVSCPCCSNSFKTFLPFNHRHGAECPYCLSLERHRLLRLFFEQFPPFKDSSQKVLHVSPELCTYDYLKSFFKSNYTPGDKFTEGYTGYPKDTIDLDITDLKFQDNSFDIILCNHVLEHVPEDRKAMKELLRVLKPGGFAMLQVPLSDTNPKTIEGYEIEDPKKRLEIVGQYDHVRAYGYEDYYDRLKEAGFNVKIDKFASSFSPKDAFKYGIHRAEELVLAYK